MKSQIVTGSFRDCSRGSAISDSRAVRTVCLVRDGYAPVGWRQQTPGLGSLELGSQSCAGPSRSRRILVCFFFLHTAAAFLGNCAPPAWRGRCDRSGLRSSALPTSPRPHVPTSRVGVAYSHGPLLVLNALHISICTNFKFPLVSVGKSTGDT